jgi:hypothetical protein
MKLVVQSLWSPDLEPPSTGAPEDATSFRILVQVALAERGAPGHEVFGFTASSVDQLAETESGSFLSHVLVLQRFSWEQVRTSVEKLLRHTESCSSWSDAIRVLAGYLRHNDSA